MVIFIFSISHFLSRMSILLTFTQMADAMKDALKPLSDIVSAHALLTGVLVVLLLILVIYCYFLRKEKFNPTATMRLTRLDGLGQERESAAGGPAAAGPALPPAAQRVLASDEFGCSTRQPVGDDAWTWMTGHVGAAEAAAGGKLGKGRLDDNEASKLLAGRR